MADAKLLRAVASDIRLYGSRLTRISEEESVQIVEDCVDEKQCFAEGSFGKLFKSDGLKNRCGITVAVKKIHQDKQLDDIPDTVKKEMNVSKVLHLFLLPLIAVIREVDEGRNTFYLISPFCEQGDLYTVLHTNKTAFNQVQRIRIVLQIALGIQHLHRFVEGFKDVIIHKDICSDNIILDGRNNARLIDFGLAQDKGDDTNTISKRIHYTHPDVGTGREATEFWDYFSFGVVIRELLTGLPPEGKKETNLFLKKMKLKDVIDNLDEKVWPEDYDTHYYLNKIAESCLQPQSRFSFQKDVVEKLLSIFEQRVWVPEKGVNPQCAQCMINPATSKAAEKMHRSYCKEAFSLCVPCEKRSILCPVKCYGCEETLKPVIGKDWAALLVAGNDTTDKQIAEAFKSDVENMEKVVTSKTPLIMGISKENVHVITPERPGFPEELLPRIKTAMKEIKESNSHTLVVYFSCLGKTIVKGKGNNSFQLGSEKELLPTIEFEKLFKQDEKTAKIQKVILFMDRCFPIKINVDENDKVKAIQLNACDSNQTALVKNQASIFTKHLIEGLKAWHCKNKDTKKSASDDYITATTLQEYTDECMKVHDRKPVMFCSGPIHSDDFKIAYDTAEDVDVEFTYGKDRKSLSVDLCQKMEDLENSIKRLFYKEVDKCDVKIQKDTHRNKDRYVDCKTVKSVMTAWVLRQPLIVTFTNLVKAKRERVDFKNLRSAYNGKIEDQWKDNASKDAKTRLEGLDKSISQKDLIDVLESDKILAPVRRELLTKRDPNVEKDVLSKGSTMTDLYRDWHRCLALDNRKYAYRALRNNLLPDQRLLNELTKHFGRQSNIISNICKRICSHIAAQERSIVDVWPAVEANCDNNIVFVIIVNRSVGIRMRQFGKAIQYSYIKRELEDVGCEGKDVINSSEFKQGLDRLSPADYTVLQQKVNAINKDLMKHHKYLMMISISPVRSIGHDSNFPKIEFEPCLVLYVLIKGFIPIKEEPFQTQYSGVTVDVREGMFKLFTGSANNFHEHLKSGCQIVNYNIGTLGGFVDYPGWGTCGLTCAHVVLNPMEMKQLAPKAENDMDLEFATTGQTVYQPDSLQESHAAGKVVKAIYREGGGGESGIDIAIFQLLQRYPVLGDFPDSKDGSPTTISYDSGKTADILRLGFGDVCKFGSVTDLTSGSVVIDAATLSVRTYEKYVVSNDYDVKLHNLIEIRSKQDESSFAERGDSGALVFCEGENKELICVGVLEGGTSNNTCVVMPISPILEQLNVMSLKNFEMNRMEQKITQRLTEQWNQNLSSTCNIVETRITECVRTTNESVKRCEQAVEKLERQMIKMNQNLQQQNDRTVNLLQNLMLQMSQLSQQNTK